MENGLEEAKAALAKSKDNMAKYYIRGRLQLLTTNQGTKSIWMPVIYRPTDLWEDCPIID